MIALVVGVAVPLLVLAAVVAVMYMDDWEARHGR